MDIAFCEAQRSAEPTHLGTVAGSPKAVTRALRRQVSLGRKLHIVYKAGPCGFLLARHFSALGWHCEVVAPSLIPRAPGERVKTDRREAIKLAKLARSGDLVAVRISSWPMRPCAMSCAPASALPEVTTSPLDVAVPHGPTC